MDTSPSELILLDGTVSSVIYRNEENGYTILRLEAPEAGEEVTVVGTMPGISPGEGLSVHGQWTRHSTYGEQFRAEIDAAPSLSDYTLTAGMVNGERAALNVDASLLTDGASTALEAWPLTLEKQGGVWKIPLETLRRLMGL